MLRLFQIVNVKSVPRFLFFHGNYVDHNTSVVLLFSVARGRKRSCKERLVVNCHMVNCWIVSVFSFDSLARVCYATLRGFYGLSKGNTDERSTSLVVIMSNDSLRYVAKDVCDIDA